MPKKALVDFDFIKELSENITKKDKKYFRAKVKNSLNGSKRDKKIEKIRHLLLAASKSDKKPGKKRKSSKNSRRDKPDKRAKVFTQFDTGSETGTGSESGSGSESSTDSEPENSKITAPANSEVSSASSESESEKGEKNNHWDFKWTVYKS